MHLTSIICVAVLVIESISHVVFLTVSQFWHHLLNKIFWQNKMLFWPTIPSFFQPETHIFFLAWWKISSQRGIIWVILLDWYIKCLVIIVCNHVITVYSENKLQHYATAYRNHKSAGEKLGLFRFCKVFLVFFQQIHYSLFRNHLLLNNNMTSM